MNFKNTKTLSSADFGHSLWLLKNSNFFLLQLHRHCRPILDELFLTSAKILVGKISVSDILKQKLRGGGPSSEDYLIVANISTYLFSCNTLLLIFCLRFIKDTSFVAIIRLEKKC